MPITFTMDDDGNVTWDRSQRGEAVTHQEAMVMAAIEMANGLKLIGHTINGLTKAVESMHIDSAIEKVSEQLEAKATRKAAKLKPKSKRRR